MKLALFIADPDIRINQQIAMGLAQELQRHEPWNVIMTHEWDKVPILYKTIQQEKPHVIVIRTGRTDPEIAAFIASISTPVVMVASNTIKGLTCPTVVTDDEAIGKMAATYLLGQRFEHFALLEFTTNADAPRAFVFRQHILNADKSLNEHLIPTPRKRLDHPASLGDKQHKLLRWLQALPKPCAIFAHSDQPGAYIIRLYAEHGIRVPEDVSVLGVDDDALFCHTVYPNLSSVHVPNAQLGAEAAKLMQDWHPGYRMIKVPPATVIERDSVRSPAIDDPKVNLTLEYLRAHVGDGVRASDLQKRTGLSPQLLVYRFRSAIGRTPMEMILKERITLASKPPKVKDLAEGLYPLPPG